MDVETAKSLYRKINSLRGESRGPVPIDPSAIAELEGLRPSILLACADVKKTDTRRFAVPSPWHAFLFMNENVRWACDGNRNRPIYRGQANAEWDPIPKLNRPDCHRDAEADALKHFCDELHRTYPDGVPRCSPDASVAAAQHYGIATSLLDFTPDPAVALFFACYRSEAPYAAVFKLPLLPALDQCGARVLLPPPFAKRIYLQRGVFVDYPSSNDEPLGSLCTRIEFPPCSDFQVIRQGAEVDLLGSDEPFLDCLAARSRNPLEAAPNVRHEEGDPMAVTSDWIDQTADLLYWLALDANAQGQQCQTEVLTHIKRENAPLMARFAQECLDLADDFGRQGFNEKAETHRRLAKLIADA